MATGQVVYLLHVEASSQVARIASSAVSESVKGVRDAMNSNSFKLRVDFCFWKSLNTADSDLEQNHEANKPRLLNAAKSRSVIPCNDCRYGLNKTHHIIHNYINNLCSQWSKRPGILLNVTLATVHLSLRLPCVSFFSLHRKHRSPYRPYSTAAPLPQEAQALIDQKMNLKSKPEVSNSSPEGPWFPCS